ncbi:MAG: hypothetical protein ACP5JH_02270 [Bacteroidota bacterium]
MRRMSVVARLVIAALSLCMLASIAFDLIPVATATQEAKCGLIYCIDGKKSYTGCARDMTTDCGTAGANCDC